MTPRMLITGGTGFLGRPAAAHALVAGAEVHVSARSRPADPPPGATVHRLDLLDRPATRDLLSAVRPTHLLHLAWVTTPGAYWTSPENHEWVTASHWLTTHFASSGGRRALLAGTCAEYDWTAGGRCHETDTPTRPATLYGACKNHLRELAERVGADTGMGVAWARLFFLYGPGEHPARLVPSVAQAVLAGQPAECTAGTQERDFLHVEDAAAAVVALLLGEVTGPVNVGSGEAVPVRAVVEAVAAAAGRPDLVRLGARPTPPCEPPLLVADVGRLRREVGWSPRIELWRGLADAVSWWRGRRAA
jgi:nucleoside-diphosphate-sugar epimerase